MDGREGKGRTDVETGERDGGCNWRSGLTHLSAPRLRCATVGRQLSQYVPGRVWSVVEMTRTLHTFAQLLVHTHHTHILFLSLSSTLQQLHRYNP